MADDTAKLEYSRKNAYLSALYPCIGMMLYGYDFGATAWGILQIEDAGKKANVSP